MRKTPLALLVQTAVSHDDPLPRLNVAHDPPLALQQFPSERAAMEHGPLDDLLFRCHLTARCRGRGRQKAQLLSRVRSDGS